MSVVPTTFAGATQLNPSITTYDKLIERVKYTLGWPLVNVEIADVQLISFINESIEYFTKYAGYTEEYLVFDTKIYKQNTGLQVEKLINSTCMYGLDQSAVNVVDLAPDMYYFSNSSVYITVSGEEQTGLNRSYQGPLLYNNVKLLQNFNYTLSAATVSITPYSYYLLNNTLCQAGSAFSVDPSLSLSGVIIQESIAPCTPVLLNQHFNSEYIVPIDAYTQYIYESNLYISGSATNDIIEGTSTQGVLVDSVSLTPTLSTYNINTDILVVEVPVNTFYVSASSLYRSSELSASEETAYVGIVIQDNILSLSAESKFITISADVVNVSSGSFYVNQNELWCAGLSTDSGTSLKGHRVNIALLEVIPDVFVYNETEINAVPVPPDSVYFYNNTLYRSGSAIPLNNGYTEIGDIIQANVFELDSYASTVNIDAVLITCEPNTYYINGQDLWKSGESINSEYSELGELILENISKDVQIQDAISTCVVDIVNLPVHSYYLYNGDLLQTSICDDVILPEGFSGIGVVVARDVAIVSHLLQGVPPDQRVSCVPLSAGTYYIFANALCRAGDISPIDGFSFSGVVVQQIITPLDINQFQTIYNLVSLPPNTLYISDSILYSSGESTDMILKDTSEIGNILIRGVVVNPLITQESMPCLNMYYDYDMSSYRKIVDVFTFEQGESTGINTLFTLEQAMAQQIYSSYMVGNFGFDLVSWEVLKGFIDTRNKVLAQKPHFRFDNRSQTLRIIPEPRPNESYLGLVGCYIERPLKDLVKERWVYDYTKALVMIAVGNARGKFAGTGLFGGGTVNANDIRQQGITEKEALEKRLMTEYIDNNPTNFFVG